MVGLENGLTDGLSDGLPTGVAVAEPTGFAVGATVGFLVGAKVGLGVGSLVGDAVGDAVGLADGGLLKGILDGSKDGPSTDIGTLITEVGTLIEVGNFEGVLVLAPGTDVRVGMAAVGVGPLTMVGSGAAGCLVGVMVVGMAAAVGLADTGFDVGPESTAIDQLPELLSKVM
jgi:hypothetical protein